MLHRLNGLLEKWIPFITPTCVLLGVTIASGVAPYSFLVPWLFAFMTFASSLGLKIEDLKTTIEKPLPIVACIVILQFIMPVFASIIGHFIFTEDMYTITGIVLAFSIPTGIVSLMWVTIFKGNRALTLTIILVNTLLSPFFIPLCLSILIGAKLSMDTIGMMSGLFWMIVFPSLLGIFINHRAKKRCEKIRQTLAPFAKFALMSVILLNSSVVSKYFHSVNKKFLLIAACILTLASLGYVIGYFTSKLMKWDRETTISLMFNSGMRNIAVGAALSIAYFPPAVTLPIVITILFQQVLASLFGKILSKVYLQKGSLI